VSVRTVGIVGLGLLGRGIAACLLPNNSRVIALSRSQETRKHLGSPDAVERVVRVTGYVNSDPDLTEQHLVINGASQLVLDVFGQAGRHARTAPGLAQPPLGASVEVEMILELKL
jgi:enamine deaminase RidA (YjgF/YER057c/UK114 family)